MKPISRREFLELSAKGTPATIAGMTALDNLIAPTQVQAAEASNNSKNANSVISLPKGGGAIKGIGETFKSNPFTGTANISIPIATSPGRNGFGPELGLQYSSGNGNGPFGLGWTLSVPHISRKTEKGIPQFKGEDTFVLSGAEDLVERTDDGWTPENDSSNTFRITYYRSRVEGLFAKIEKWDRIKGKVEEGKNNSFWKITTKDNITSIYGLTKNASLQNQDIKSEDNIFQWNLELTYDARGNIIQYEYKKDTAEDLRDINEPFEQHRRKEKNRVYQLYLKFIYYGNLVPFIHSGYVSLQNQLTKSLSKSDHFFTVVFDYGEHGKLDDNQNQIITQDIFSSSDDDNAPKVWNMRKDPFSSYRAGFEIRTYRRCQRVLMFHNIDNNIDPELVKSTDFHYDQNDFNQFSMLTRVTQRGYRKLENYNGSLPFKSEEFTLPNSNLTGAYSSHYAIKSIPPLELGYSTFQPNKQQFKSFKADGGDMPPKGLNNPNYSLVDLFGTGLPDVLETTSHDYYYWKNKGDGEFERRNRLKNRPQGITLEQQGVGFGDMAGDGQADLLVHSGYSWGYYESNDKGGWKDFRPYRNQPSFLLDDPNIRLVDLTGDGKADVLRTDDRYMAYFPCQGEKGFDEPKIIRRIYDLEKFPDVYFNDERVQLADMNGDGLKDIVLVHSGRIDYWPNLGYGKFGQRITMKGAPHFGYNFDPKRLFLVDIDGTGPSDIVYVESGQVRFWFNQSGNSWSDENIIYGTPPVTNLDSLQLADMFGTGTTGVLWSSDYQGAGRSNYMFLDFTGGIKPYVLTEMNNNMGATTRARYRPSSYFFIQDRNKRKKWKTNLPFPVQALEKVEVIDHISHTKLVTTYCYHHGYYDGKEREFRGFGLVEQCDTESYDLFKKEDLHGKVSFENSSKEFHVPPVLTKTWFHTGAYDTEHLRDELFNHHKNKNSNLELSELFSDEYYNKDPKAILLPNTVIESSHGKIDLTSLSEAYRSLRGQVLRQEIYALDAEVNPEKTQHPYTVTASNFSTKMLQPKGKNNHAIYHVRPRETLTFHYERNPDDPRIEHQFTLEVDQYGNVEKSCNVFYKRRDVTGRQKEQNQIRAIVNINRFINQDKDFYLIGISSEEKTFEIGGLDLEDGHYYQFNSINNEITEALKDIKHFGVTLSGESLQSRLLSWKRNYYWDEKQNDVLGLYYITKRALLHHSEKAVFSKQQINDIFADKVTADMLADKNDGGGYVEAREIDGDFDLANRFWWNPGIVQHYQKYDKANQKRFYLPTSSIDPFGAETIVSYDDYNLVPLQVKDAVNNVTKADIDYVVLQPHKMTDMNDNISEVKFDPLGMVYVTSIYGTENGEDKGDSPLNEYADKHPESVNQIMENPHDYIQNATSFFYYDLFRWLKNFQTTPLSNHPAEVLNVLRETHVSDLGGNQKSELQYQITYSDGFGRELQKKLQVEPGQALLRDESGKPVIDNTSNKLKEGYSQERWLVSGRTIYNNKGKPVKQYEPFFSITHVYESENEVTTYGVSPIIHYDPLLRVIRTDIPIKRISLQDQTSKLLHVFTKVDFNPWEQVSWDENDTIKESEYWLHFQDLSCTPNQNNTNHEIDALNKACLHVNTPQTSKLNNVGKPFQVVQKKEKDIELVTHYELDIQGNELSITDPRQYQENQSRPDEEKVNNFIHTFDMAGNKLSIKSVDAGHRFFLGNALGQQIHSWDGRGVHTQTRYDELQRPREVYVIGIELDQIVEKIHYGEDQSEDKKHNLRGQVYEHYDQAGILAYNLYDIKGQQRLIKRQFREEYKKEVNWNDIPKEAMEQEEYTIENSYDALGRTVYQVNPDQSINLPKYNSSGLLRSLNVEMNDEIKSFVENIEYNAKGQRLQIVYNPVEEDDVDYRIATDYTYEPETFRLKTIKTVRKTDGKTVQDLAYWYDPVGNITRLKDLSPIHLCDNVNHELIEKPLDYTYDALYQLTRATGRMHPDLQKKSYKNHDLKQSKFFYCQNQGHPNDMQRMTTYGRRYWYDDSGNLYKIKHIPETDDGWTRNIKVSETSNRAIPEQINDAVDPDSFYDENGNMQKLEHLRDIRWNYRDNIASVDIIQRDNENPDSEYYVYDSSGMRARKIFERYDDNGNLVEIEEKCYIGNCEIKRKFYGRISENNLSFEKRSLHIMDEQQRIALVQHWVKDDHKIEKNVSPMQRVHYQFNNHLESAILEMSEMADVISYEEYFPFGGTAFIAVKNQKYVNAKEYRYGGKERDDSTTLYYYGNRYSIPWIGRWLSADPAFNIDGSNLYSYVAANPLKYIDNNGENIAIPYSQRMSTISDVISKHGNYTIYRYKVFKYKSMEEYEKALAVGELKEPIGSFEVSFEPRKKKDKPSLITQKEQVKEITYLERRAGKKRPAKWAFRITDPGYTGVSVKDFERGGYKIRPHNPRYMAHPYGPDSSTGCITFTDQAMLREFNKKGKRKPLVWSNPQKYAPDLERIIASEKQLENEKKFASNLGIDPGGSALIVIPSEYFVYKQGIKTEIKITFDMEAWESLVDDWSESRNNSIK